ncbi:MAG: hypothetical protein JWQ81_3659 [Amycolatopsis sp.]|uniref:hypothetical protein n=1 Tax=Amycolatopsis sp. TaxID=37632 RepID=UPI00261F9769|nr:hypothetical protein [Amycolatopsis sp.]MCU1682920.1 hypothetical protein [Amycolatopsis sp.]
MGDLNFSQGHTLQISVGPGAATVNLTPGTGVHRLAVTVTVASVGLEEGLPIQLSGDLHIELNNANRWLGPLHIKHVTTRGYTCTEQLTCSLSDSQLRALEALRDGKDLPLRLHLDAVLLYPVDGLYPVAQAQEVALVRAEVWARQLASVGTAVVMEVLVPLPLDGSELRRAVGRIREAKGHITDGKYEEAVIKGRAALDYVREVVPADPSAQKTVAKVRTQAQRWRVLIDDLYSLASGANHDDAVTEDFTWSRDDAVMIVSTVAGLLGRLPR